MGKYDIDMSRIDAIVSGVRSATRHMRKTGKRWRSKAVQKRYRAHVPKGYKKTSKSVTKKVTKRRSSR